MKPLFKVLPILLFAGVIGTSLYLSVFLDSPLLVQAQSPAPSALIPVSLPHLADVMTKDGTLTGQVAAFDPKTQTIKFSSSGGSRVVKIADIKDGVKFRANAKVCCQTNGDVIIRGPDPAKAIPKTWQGIALDAFRLKDPGKGLAEVSLAGVKKPSEIRGILSVAQKSLYVVDEIEFQSASKMTIKVTARDR